MRTALCLSALLVVVGCKREREPAPALVPPPKVDATATIEPTPPVQIAVGVEDAGNPPGVSIVVDRGSADVEKALFTITSEPVGAIISIDHRV